MKSRFAAICLLVVFVAAARAETKLQHKLEPGSSFKTESVVQINQTLNINGSDIETKVEVISTAKSEVGKRDNDGNLPVEVSVDALQISIDSPGGEYRFDSVNPDKAGSSPLEIVRDVHKAMIKGKTKVTYDKDNKIVSVENDKDAFANLSADVQALAGGQLDPEYQKKNAQQTLDQIPSEAIKKGDSWERTTVTDLGAKQLMTFKSKYTYDGTVEMNGETLDKIKVKTLSADLQIADDAPVPIKLKKSELKIAESEGEILFSRKRGLIVQDNSKIRIKGDLTFVAGDRELPSTLDLTFKIEARTNK